ncbi:MAG: hypothetical protein V1875_01435 [Candidatus Altiarchaeota archaeon]
MNRRGVFFTLGVTLVGWAFFSFSVSHDGLSKDLYAMDRLVELERAESVSSNVATNIVRTFDMFAGVRVAQSGATASFEGTLPHSLGQYASQVSGLRRACSDLLNVSLDLQPVPYVMGGNGANYTQDSFRIISLSLPEDSDSIVVSGVFGGNIGNCSVDCEPGDARLYANITGNSGFCIRSCRLNITGESAIAVNDGELSLAITGDRLTLENRADRPLDYAISISANRTGYFHGPILAARIVSEYGKAKKTMDGVML